MTENYSSTFVQLYLHISNLIYFQGSVGDQLGRRKALLFSLSMNALFGLISSISSNYFQLLLFRFLSGVGVGGMASNLRNHESMIFQVEFLPMVFSFSPFRADTVFISRDKLKVPPSLEILKRM